MSKAKKWWCGVIAAVLLVAVPLLASCAEGAAPLPADTVGAVKVETPPTIDGTVDSAWSKAKPISIKVASGANLPDGATTVELKALYTTGSVYFLAQWADTRLKATSGCPGRSKPTAPGNS